MPFANDHTLSVRNSSSFEEWSVLYVIYDGICGEVTAQQILIYIEFKFESMPLHKRSSAVRSLVSIWNIIKKYQYKMHQNRSNF